MAESPSIPSNVMEENENLRQQVRELENENESLRKNIEELLKQLESSEDEKNIIRQYNKTLEQELTETINDCQKEMRTNEEALQEKMHRKQEEYEMEKLAFQLKVEDLEIENQMFRSENDTAMGSMCEFIQNFQKEKDKMRQQIQAHQTDTHDANATPETFKQFKDLFEEIKQEIESLNNQNQDLKQETVAKNMAVQEEVKELKCILQGLTSFEHESNTIKQQNDALEQEVQELTKKLADCQKEMRQKEEALHEKMHRKHEEYEMEKLALQEKVEDVETDNQAYRLENDAAIRRMCEMNHNFEKEKKKMRKQIQALQNDIREANETLETLIEFKELYEKLQQENESLKNQNQDLKQEIEAKNIAVQEEVQEIKSVLEDLKSFEEESNRIKQQNNALEQEVQELTKKLADYQKEMRQKEEDLQEKMQELDKGEPHQSSFEDIPTESASHMETPQEQTFKPRDVEEKDQGGWISWLRGAALHFALSHYSYPY
ncbi:unnamed protein product [Oreochromis niloticus]|nr:unnamed protein product [Mustela putorius furo]